MSVIKSFTLTDKEWELCQIVKKLLIQGGVLPKDASDNQFFKFCIIHVLQEVGNLAKGGENPPGNPGKARGGAKS
jgi:hypothetical protein